MRVLQCELQFLVSKAYIGMLSFANKKTVDLILTCILLQFSKTTFGKMGDAILVFPVKTKI